MATEPHYGEQRRSQRVLLRIPVKVQAGDGAPVSESAETVSVSRYGAMLRMASPMKIDSMVQVLNTYSRQVESFRVVWVSELPKEEHYEVGVEITTPREDFWGIQFPIKSR